jgi:hypothetical protein
MLATATATNTTVTTARPVAPTPRAAVARPLRVLIYGVEGVGKSTFAAQTPDPVFLCPEDGVSQLDIARFPTPRTWADVLEAVRVLTYEEHDYKTLVIDTLDWLEPLCHEHVCMMTGVAHIDEIAYGKGYAEVVEQWRQLLGRLEMLVRNRRMNVTLVAHATMRRLESADGLHDRFQLKIYERAAELLRGWCDAILFARHERVQITRALAPRKPPEARLLHTDDSIGWEARNCFGLPSVMPLDWDDFAHAVHGFCPSDAPALRTQLVAMIPYLREAARAAQVMRDWAGEDPVKLFQLLDRVKSKLALEAAGQES